MATKPSLYDFSTGNLVDGILDPTTDYQVANKRYVDNELDELEDYVDDEILDALDTETIAATTYNLAIDGAYPGSITAGGTISVTLTRNGTHAIITVADKADINTNAGVTRMDTALALPARFWPATVSARDMLRVVSNSTNNAFPGQFAFSSSTGKLSFLCTLDEAGTWSDTGVGGFFSIHLAYRCVGV